MYCFLCYLLAKAIYPYGSSFKILDSPQLVCTLISNLGCCYEFASAGTPEAGGWTTREVKRILRGLAGLNFV